MGLFSFGGSASNTSYNQNSTTNPILSPYWTTAYGNASTNAGPNGITPVQQPGINYFSDWMNGGPARTQTQNAVNAANSNNNFWTDATTNGMLQLSGEYAQVNQNGLAPIFNNPAPQAAGASSDGTSLVNAQSGASQSSPYAQLYGSHVTDPALQAYDYGTDRAFSALDARTAAGGGFANNRSGLAYSDLANQAALGRGQLSAQLNTQGLTNAFGFGQTDASRNLTAQSTNASNTLNNNQFNAGLQQANNQFNVNAQQQNTNQKLQAADQWSNNVTNRVNVGQQMLQNITGITQQNLQNIMTPTGIDMNVAQSLVASGAITQDQLTQLVNLSQASNGSTTNITGNSNTASGGFKFGK